MRAKNKLVPWVFSAPALLVFSFVVVFPVVWNVVLSLYKWDGISVMKYIGTKNYNKLFTDKTFIQALLNNYKFCLISTIYQFCAGLFMAMLLNSIDKGPNILKVIYFVPCIITTVALSQIFMKLLALEPIGVVNSILKAVGITPVSFLGNASTALYTLSLIDAYKYCGIYMIILYSALVGVPDDIVEASIIDGCGWFRQYFSIKIPIIKGVCGMVLIMLINGTLKSFEMPYVLTNGGPGTSTEMMATYMYKTAFSKMDYGYSSTLAVFLLVECLIIVSVLRKLTPGNESI